MPGTQTIEFEGQTHEFPADFTDADIQKALSSHGPATTSAAAAGSTSAAGSSPGALDSAWNYVKEIGQGVGRGVKNTVAGVGDAMMPRGEPGSAQRKEEVGYGPTGRLLLHTGQDIGAGLKSAWDARSKAAQSGEGWAGQTLAAGENLPIVGNAVKYAESGGTGMFNPKSVGAAAEVSTYAAAPKVVGKVAGEAIDLPKTATDFFRRAKSLNSVTEAAAGVWKEQVQKPIITLQERIKQEATKTIQQAIEADKAAQTVPGQGTISTGPAIAAVTKAMEDTGHYSKPVQTLVDNLNANPMMTLEDAQHLRSTVGSMASRASDAKVGKIGWAAYDELTKAMGDRVEELQGTRQPWEHSNNEFRAAFNLNEGITGKMMEPLTDRHDAIPNLEKVRDADLTEIKAQMKKYGMNPADLDKAQANAKSVTAAHASVSGKFNKSLYAVVLAGGGAVALPIAVYATARGAGLYGMAPMLLASYMAAKTRGIPAEMKTGEILRKLKVNPDAVKVRPEVEGPKTFQYKDQDQVYSAPKGGPSGPTAQMKADVLAALKNQGYKPADAARAVQGATGNDFASLFKSAIQRGTKP